VRSVETILFLVCVATVVATFARRISVPPPSLLVVAGLAVGLIPGVPPVQITPQVVSLVVLPPLLYAAGEELSLRDLRRLWAPVTALAVGLVLTSAAAVGAVAMAVAPLPASLAFVLGTVLASTDPVAVSALARRLALPMRLQTLVQAESLFNDATSLILFRVTVGVAVAGGVVSWRGVALETVWLALGGTLVGGLVAVGVAVIRRRTEDPVLESVVALVTPYGAYVVAEALRTSGVTAVVVASVILGVLAPKLTNARIRLQLTAVYGTVIFLLESVVFGLIGLQLPMLVRRLAAADAWWPLAALAIAATLLLVRVAWVFPVTTGLWRPAAVVSWAGARGVVPLAATLSIPLLDNAGRPLPQRDLVVVLATAVIVTSLVVQGFTLAPLVRRLGLAVEHADARSEYAEARVRVARAGVEYLDMLADAEAVAPVVIERVRSSLLTGHDHADVDRRVRRDVVAVQIAELRRLYEEGAIGERTRRRIQRQLDLEDARFSDEA
jgi:monovalent cation/hydrogen antiporter